jgi:hypothetical protein
VHPASPVASAPPAQPHPAPGAAHLQVAVVVDEQVHHKLRVGAELLHGRQHGGQARQVWRLGLQRLEQQQRVEGAQLGAQAAPAEWQQGGEQQGEEQSSWRLQLWQAWLESAGARRREGFSGRVRVRGPLALLPQQRQGRGGAGPERGQAQHRGEQAHVVVEHLRVAGRAVAQQRQAQRLVQLARKRLAHVLPVVLRVLEDLRRRRQREARGELRRCCRLGCRQTGACSSPTHATTT